VSERSARAVVEELLWRVADGMTVDQSSCRDDIGLLDQLRD
jgi:hypothetical protein